MTPSNSSRRNSLILGISASHNGGACILRGDDILVAIQEERLTRQKRKRVYAGKSNLSIQYCLDAAGIQSSDLDSIVVSVQGSASDTEQDVRQNPQLALLRDEATISYAPHHLCHAISAFATSGYNETDVLVIDGVGSPWIDISKHEKKIAGDNEHCEEWLSCYQFSKKHWSALIKHMADVSGKEPKNFPNSLGKMFESVSRSIFDDPMQAGKVMGLAAYGDPVISRDDFLNWNGEEIEFKNAFLKNQKKDGAWPSNQRNHENLASSVQDVLEETVLKQLRILRKVTNGSNLCCAGGVMLNTLLNERIIRESGYQSVHIIPAAEDSGVVIGAAYFGLMQLTNEIASKKLPADSMGYTYKENELNSFLDGSPGIDVSKLPPSDGKPYRYSEIVDRLCDGQVGGWFSGGSELGPRALGHRSMICDPRSAAMKDYLNNAIKRREDFRPFAPMVLKECATDWFDFGQTEPLSPFMLRVASVHPDKAAQIPAVTHIDGTARVQTIGPENGSIYDLVKAFYNRTGVPVLLNTSLNVNGEPIVETPLDAWRCLQTTKLDFCVIENYLLTKPDQAQSLLDFFPRPTIKRVKLLKNQKLDDGQIVTLVDAYTDTPWGETSYKIPVAYHHLLHFMDSKRSGHDLLNVVHRGDEKSKIKKWVLTALRELHQMRLIEFINTNTQPLNSD